MRNTETYRIIFKEGFEEGFLKGFHEGRQKTGQDIQRWMQFCRNTTLSVIQECFPDLLDLAQVRLEETGDLLQLAQLGLNISNARTLEEAREALEDGGVSSLCITKEI
jgi:predicted transposase YdaD